jgi:hypothetical protein
MDSGFVLRAPRNDEKKFMTPWIASRSLSSGAHSRDPSARNDGLRLKMDARHKAAQGRP